MPLTKDQKIAIAQQEFDRATADVERDPQDVINDTKRVTDDKARELQRIADRTAQRIANKAYRGEVLALVQAE